MFKSGFKTLWDSSPELSYRGLQTKGLNLCPPSWL
jgi:hypothetical protein